MQRMGLYLFLLILFISFGVKGQVGYIVTVAGGGTSTAEGVPATTALINSGHGVCTDFWGNVYYGDATLNVIRKIDAATGLVHTVAGNGTTGYSGDYGPATSAALNMYFYMMIQICVDGSGNLYIADINNNAIRRVDAVTGIITPYVGTGVAGYTGDGGPATSAKLNTPAGLAFDHAGNLIIADDGNNVIRKVNTSTGIITTIAGVTSGLSGNSGNGGPATSARIWEPQSIALDTANNIYFGEGFSGGEVRKINQSTGIISLVAGLDGSCSMTGDGGPATAAGLGCNTKVAVDVAGNVFISNSNLRMVDVMSHNIYRLGGSKFYHDHIPFTESELGVNDMAFDNGGNLYYSDGGRILKIILNNAQTSAHDSFRVYTNELCNGPDLRFATANAYPGLKIKTDYGDGTVDTTVISGVGNGFASHIYTTSGSYTIKHVLMNSASNIDSLTYTYSYSFCRTLPLTYYYDSNANCVKDFSEPLLTTPHLAEVDSNGTAIDTISALSGYYYNAYGHPGDVYTFKLLQPGGNLLANCPVTGIWTDTLQATHVPVDTAYIGFTCGPSSLFDIRENVSLTCNVISACARIIVDNTYCNSVDANLTVNMSPKYNYFSSYPTATTVVGNTATWDINGLNANTSGPRLITVYYHAPATLASSDTIHSSFYLSPLSGDSDIVNNTSIRVDTANGAYDPNHISVNPTGIIQPFTTLKYTIEFENTGNDIAHNIYLLDTLSQNIDAKSIRIIAASSQMKTSLLRSGPFNVLRFDFPNINLPDSSHHGQNSGMVVYSINTRAGLTTGNLIKNIAGIYFDANPVVNTNTVTNIVGEPNKVGYLTMNSNSVSVYPNPATSSLYINNDNNLYTSYCITNAIGQRVDKSDMINGVRQLNISQYQPGIYFITLLCKNGDRENVQFVKLP